LFHPGEFWPRRRDQLLAHNALLRAFGDQIRGDGAISFGGNVGQSTTAGDGIRAYIGRAAELWAADGFGFFAVINALFHEGRYAAEAFDDKNNLLRAQQHGLLRGRTAVVFGASAIPAPVYRPALADPNLFGSDGKSQGSSCSTYRSH
jgi:hypothetical protein